MVSPSRPLVAPLRLILLGRVDFVCIENLQKTSPSATTSKVEH